MKESSKTETLEIDESKYSDPGQLIVPVNNLLIISSVIFIWQEKP